MNLPRKKMLENKTHAKISRTKVYITVMYIMHVELNLKRTRKNNILNAPSLFFIIQYAHQRITQQQCIITRTHAQNLFKISSSFLHISAVPCTHSLIVTSCAAKQNYFDWPT